MYKILNAALLLLSAPVLADVSPALEAIRAKNGVPALGAAEIQGGVVVESGFTGVRRAGDPTPVRPTDQFHLGSCTKAMTGTLLAVLVAEGRLRWNWTLASLFPTHKIHPALAGVTVEMIAAHRAGFPRDVPDRALWGSLWNNDAETGRARVVEAALAAAPATPPGAQFVYSNVGYMVLGAIVDAVTGSTWESALSSRIFAPLKMGSCGFGPAGNPDSVPPDQPWGHRPRGGSYEPVKPDALGDNPPAMNPAARVHCSLEDWGKFLQIHIDGFNGIARLGISAAGFKKLHEAYPGQEYTPGGWIRTSRPWAGGPVLTHEGSNTYSLAVTWIGPLRGRAYVAGTNAATDAAHLAADEAIGALISRPR